MNAKKLSFDKRPNTKIIPLAAFLIIMVPITIAVFNQMTTDANKKAYRAERNMHLTHPVPFDSTVWKKATRGAQDEEGKKLFSENIRHRMLKDALLHHNPRYMHKDQLMANYGPFDKNPYGPDHQGYLLSLIQNKQTNETEEVWLEIHFDAKNVYVYDARYYCPKGGAKPLAVNEQYELNSVTDFTHTK